MTPSTDELHTDLTSEIIGAAFEVSNTLGAGFLEKLYERALTRELTLRGLTAIPQAAFAVTYKGLCIGDYHADILVADTVLIELKCAERLVGDHIAQCMNYLSAAGKDICLLINFQKPVVEWKRITSASLKNRHAGLR